jgi:uncharacterized iron-regulated protein
VNVRAVLVAFVIAAVALTGCGTIESVVSKSTMHKRRPVRILDPSSVYPDPVRFVGDASYAWIDGASGKALSFDAVTAQARAAQVIILGEQHDQSSHHEMQRRVINALAVGGELVVGLEMLTWEKQAALDAFNTGDIDADALAAQVSWHKAWGFKFDLYRHILVDGHAAGARFVALNAPRELVRAVRTKGIDGLAPGEARMLPELDLGDAEHRAWFEGIFAAGTHPMADADVESFYVAQVVWDEAMAAGVARALTRGAERVVVAGAGHVARGRGIPQRVERRLASARVLTIVPLPDVDAENVVEVVRGAVVRGEGDILVVPSFEEQIAL